MSYEGTRKPNEKFLLLAAKSGHPFIVAAFLGREEVDINVKSGHGQTALSLAAENGHEEIVTMLLTRHDIDPNTQDMDGQTPLGWAAFNGHAVVVASLLHRPDIRVDVRDIDGRTPLSWAIMNRHDLVLGLLLNRLGVGCGHEIREFLYNFAQEPKASKPLRVKAFDHSRQLPRPSTTIQYSYPCPRKEEPPRASDLPSFFHPKAS